MPRAATIALLFLARSSSLGFNQSLWVLSTERFPTRVRATGVGAVTMFARIGGIVAALTHPDDDGPLPLIEVKHTAARSNAAAAAEMGEGELRVGNVKAPLALPSRPELVPTNFGLANGEPVETACGHRFHAACYARVLETSSEREVLCPMCRTEGPAVRFG